MPRSDTHLGVWALGTRRQRSTPRVVPFLQALLHVPEPLLIRHTELIGPVVDVREEDVDPACDPGVPSTTLPDASSRGHAVPEELVRHPTLPRQHDALQQRQQCGAPALSKLRREPCEQLLGSGEEELPVLYRALQGDSREAASCEYTLLVILKLRQLRAAVDDSQSALSIQDLISHES